MDQIELHAKLSEIQARLKVPKAQKNTFGNYNYRSCEDILEAVKPLLCGITLTITDELVMIGSRYYVRATACFGMGITANGFAREEETKKGMDSSQITGAASSYARKYALNGLFLIDDTKDAETNESQGEGAGYVTKAQIAEMAVIIEEKAVDVTRFLKFLDAEAIDKIKTGDFSKAMASLKAKKVEKKEGAVK